MDSLQTHAGDVVDPSPPELRRRAEAAETALKAREAEVQRLRARDARLKDEIARAHARTAELMETNLGLGNKRDANVAAHEKAMRDVEDFKRALEEATARAKGYQKQAEDRQVTILTLQDELRRGRNASPRAAETGPQTGPLDSRGQESAKLLERENADLRAKLSELRTKLADVQSAQVSLRQAAHTAVGDERRKGAAQLQEQLARLQGPEGFSLLKRENSDLRDRLSELRNQHTELRRQAQVAVNAAEERARASEAGRAVAVDLGRRLQTQLSSLMGDPSELLLHGNQRQPFPVAPSTAPAAATAIAGGAGTAPPPAAPSLEKIPKHLREIERWFDAIPERFRANVPAAKLGQHLKNNANNKQALEDAIAQVKKLTTDATPFVPRGVLAHIQRGPEGWERPFPDSSPEAMSASPSASATAPIHPAAFAAPGMTTSDSTRRNRGLRR